MHSSLRPSPAMVVALIALFVALGGSAAALSGSNTVQTDDLGPGSQVTAPDVAANAVNGQDVVDNSLTGADVLESSLTGNARKLIFSSNIANAKTTIATVGPYTIKAQCSNPSPSFYDLLLYVRGPAGTANYTFIERANDNAPDPDSGGVTSNTRQIPANQDTLTKVFRAATSNVDPPEGDFTRAAGTVMLRSGSVLVQVDLNAVVDATFPQTFPQDCFLYGTATRAT